MPELIELTIFGDPKGQPRPRAFARRMGSKFVARVYDSDVADDWKAAVDGALLTRAIANELASREGPFAVAMEFVFERPKSHFDARGLVKRQRSETHLQKPDLDNLAKLILDRITKSGRYWGDDAQVMSLQVSKHWRIDAGQSYCTLRIEYRGEDKQSC